VQHVFVGGACGVGNHLVAHEAAVDPGVLLVGAGARAIGQAGVAAHAHAAGLVIDGHRAGQEVFAQHVGQALRQAGGARVTAPLLDQPAFVPESKAHVGSRQRVAAQRLDAVRQFGGVALEELAPRRHGKEQLAHLHRGADGARGGAQFAAAGVQLPGAGLLGGARQQGQLGDGGDGRQRLAAKTHGRHRLQLGQAGDLAGGVAPEGDGQLVRSDAGAVVLDADQSYAAGQQPHRDLAGAGV